MKKKFFLSILIIIVVALAIFAINKFRNSSSQYEVTKIESYNYFKYSENGKFGVIDKEGNIVIDANYKDIIIPNPEKDIFICYNEDTEKAKIYNLEKKEIFSKYNNIEPIKLKNIASVLCYEKNVLKYEKDGLYGLVDFNEKEITKNIYSSIENLQSTEGKFIVQKDNKYGVVNTNGKILVKPEYDQIATDGYYNNKTEYSNSGFIVSNTTEDGYRYGYINSEGKQLLKNEYNEIIRITELEDLYLIASKSGQYGVYKNSKEIIPHEYQSISYTENGAIIIEKNNRYGLANLDGKILLDTKYDNIEERGIYVYAENSKESQVYDVNGNKIDMNYYKIIYKTSNDKYRISTILNNDIVYYGIENSNGENFVKPEYMYIEYAYNDYFIAKDKSDKFGVIDSKGKKIIDFKYDVIQKIKDKNIIEIIDMESSQVELYSSNLENILKIEEATIYNEDEYVLVTNKSEKYYFDKEGNKIEENSDIIANSQNKKLPENIGNYEKVQFSIENAYYVKKIVEK